MLLPRQSLFLVYPIWPRTTERGHTNGNAPDPIRIRKLSLLGYRSTSVGDELGGGSVALLLPAPCVTAIFGLKWPAAEAAVENPYGVDSLDSTVRMILPSVDSMSFSNGFM